MGTDERMFVTVVTGRIDNLVDLVYDRFKNRYFPNERLIVDIIGDK